MSHPSLPTFVKIKNEFIHLRELSHENIVKVYEIYIDKQKGRIYTVMELIKGKEMFEVINQLGSYSGKFGRLPFLCLNHWESSQRK